MIVYLDSSIVIRQLVGTKTPWDQWGSWASAYSSTLMRTECYRTANLLRLSGKLDDEQRARLGNWIERVCDSITLVPVTENVLRRAADAFPTAVGTTQAIHLATLVELQSAHGITCQIATCDEDLLRAAESMGFSDALKAPAAAPHAAAAAPSSTPNDPPAAPAAQPQPV